MIATRKAGDFTNKREKLDENMIIIMITIIIK